jgi:Fe-coproporphyrin III synthase
MDLSVITTYRCDSKCQMCYIWQNPTDPKEEIKPEQLKKLPGGFDNVNVTGGEPTLRSDLMEICDVLYPKAKTLEISSNGLHHERLIPIIKKYPDIKIRFSLEGSELTNNSIRGEKDGYKKKIDGLKVLKSFGGTDLGFATVVQDENAEELMDIYDLSCSIGVELSTSTLHNGWQFHKNDNFHYARIKSAREVEKLIVAMLKTWSIKNWFRAYMNLGLIEKILGHTRLHQCVAGTEFIFIDPWSDVWACNVRKDLPMGNLGNESWDDILKSDMADESIKKVEVCSQNCWMVTTARTAMRSNVSSKLPKIGPFYWVIHNKLRIILGMEVNFNRYVDYKNVLPNKISESRQEEAAKKDIQRISFLGVSQERKLQKKSDEHYRHDEYYNL